MAATKRVFVISDLHLGGRPDEAARSQDPPFQINYSYSELVDFIDWVASFGPPAELVINGDLVDFLAVDDWKKAADNSPWTGDEALAIDKLDTALARAVRSDGRSFVDAVRDLVGHGADCTILLGNHDVELSLPGVRAHLGALFSSRGRRPRFIYDGEAYAVGRVLIEHGNRYDAWNVVDHGLLRQERSVRSRGLPVGETAFVPPAGSELVVRVMNRLKGKYRFIDLLKPETAAVLPLLLVLSPDKKQALESVATIAALSKQKAAHELEAPARPRRSGDLSSAMTSGAREVDALSAVLREELGPDDARLFEMPSGDLSSLRLGGARTAAFLAALRRLNRTDRCFDTGWEEPRYRTSAEEILGTGRFDAVVFGHTHLPKDISINGNKRYLNTGTWCDVMRLPDALLTDGPAAQGDLLTFVEHLETNELTSYRRRYRAYVEAEISEDGVPASIALRAYGGKGREREGELPARGGTR
jgi:UDP-2,3-diacylglucosamine pyrophosphatase LpxH